MTILFLALWLQMGAQPKLLTDCSGDAKMIIGAQLYICVDGHLRAADETDGKPWKSQNQAFGPRMCGGDPPHPCDEPPVDRVDVPAVQVKSSAKLTLAYAGNCVHGYGFEGEKWQCTGKLVWSCADKSRILEHDENSPPKYWCRKVAF